MCWLEKSKNLNDLRPILFKFSPKNVRRGEGGGNRVNWRHDLSFNINENFILGRFLHFYCRYLSSEKKRLDDITDTSNTPDAVQLPKLRLGTVNKLMLF